LIIRFIFKTVYSFIGLSGRRAKQNIEDDNYQKPRDLPFKSEDIIDAEFEKPE
jgi:hypothetical protein